MDQKLILVWTFRPVDYFEDVIDADDYAIAIGNGKVEITVSQQLYDATPELRKRLYHVVNSRFLGVQLLTHQPYQLTDNPVRRSRADGTNKGIVYAEVEESFSMDVDVEILVIDRDGNVIVGPCADGIGRKKELAELAALAVAQDALAGSLLGMYDKAVRDPENELIHLYEIREALSKEFGGESGACATLGVSRKEWSHLGELANDPQIGQGRHRGKNVGSLRDATATELEEARAIARKLVEQYMKRY